MENAGTSFGNPVTLNDFDRGLLDGVELDVYCVPRGLMHSGLCRGGRGTRYLFDPMLRKFHIPKTQHL